MSPRRNVRNRFSARKRFVRTAFQSSDWARGSRQTHRLAVESLEDRRLLAVEGRYIFYNESLFDGGSAAIDATDDFAIAYDKTAYIPNGTTANFNSVTSYSRGINGIIVDLDGAGFHALITAADFEFKVGNDNSPGAWADAPAPSAVAVRLGEGATASDRVEITWATGAITNEWLLVQVLVTPNTGLVATNVFFWGNKIGDIGGGTNTAFSVLVTSDVAGIQANLGGGSTITNLYDIDRSGAVLVTTDRALALANLGSITRINITGGPFAPEGGDGGIASALAVSGGAVSGEASAPTTLPTSVAVRLENAASSSGVVAKHYEAMPWTRTSDASDDDGDDDDTSVNEELLDVLVAGL